MKWTRPVWHLTWRHTPQSEQQDEEEDEQHEEEKQQADADDERQRNDAKRGVEPPEQSNRFVTKTQRSARMTKTSC